MASEKLLPGQIYEPIEGKYDLPIFDHDNMISAYTWRYLIDTYIANYGHDPAKLDKHLREFLKMIREDVMDTYSLVKEDLRKEIADA